jgi:hypothetical protein
MTKLIHHGFIENKQSRIFIYFMVKALQIQKKHPKRKIFL